MRRSIVRRAARIFPADTMPQSDDDEEAAMTGMARGSVATFVSILLSTPAIAQSPPATQRSGPDPNEVVCEKVEVIGSRLQTKRVCMTRAEWADRRKEDREYLERRQTERGLIQPG